MLRDDGEREEAVTGGSSELQAIHPCFHPDILGARTRHVSPWSSTTATEDERPGPGRSAGCFRERGQAGERRLERRPIGLGARTRSMNVLTQRARLGHRAGR